MLIITLHRPYYGVLLYYLVSYYYYINHYIVQTLLEHSYII
jgi:hypothetical protein